MKKWIVRIVIILVALLVIATVTIALCLDGIVKKGVETVGPRITKVDVKLDGAHISVIGGSANLKGLFVGNPSGYTTDSAIKVGEVSVSLKPMSVFGDRIVVNSINVKSPQITLEGGVKKNNLTKIEDNVNGASSTDASAGSPTAASGTSKKIQVGDLLISGAVLRVKSPLLGDKMLSVTLPDIHLTDLGTGTDGITPAELTDKVMKELMKEVVPACTKLLKNAGAEAIGLGKGAEKQGENTVKKATGGLKNLFGQ